MSSEQTAYLVVRRDDGFGDVFPLFGQDRYTIGRAPNSCRIRLKDEKCSREHAEVYWSSDAWKGRDLSSRNGTWLNGLRVEAETELSPTDELRIGETHFLFVETMDQLPTVRTAPLTESETPSEREVIKKRLSQTRFSLPAPAAPEADADSNPETPPPTVRRSMSRALAQLYRLGLDMASAMSQDELIRIVLDGLLEGI